MKLIGDRTAMAPGCRDSTASADPARRDRYLSDGLSARRSCVCWRIDAATAFTIVSNWAPIRTMTMMMKRRFDFELSLANYFGEGSPAAIDADRRTR
jgi:hypothetical protein